MRVSKPVSQLSLRAFGPRKLMKVTTFRSRCCVLQHRAELKTNDLSVTFDPAVLAIEPLTDVKCEQTAASEVVGEPQFVGGLKEEQPRRGDAL
jgi:hypothetical protein